MSQNVQINWNRLDYLTLTQNIDVPFCKFEVLSTRNHVKKLVDPQFLFRILAEREKYAIYYVKHIVCSGKVILV